LLNGQSSSNVYKNLLAHVATIHYKKGNADNAYLAIQKLLFKGDVAFISVALLLLLAVFGFLFK